MPKSSSIFCSFLLGFALAITASAQEGATKVRLSEPWRTGYDDAQAQAAHVIGFWRFEPDAPQQDASGNGHELTLDGAKAVSEGRFGGALQSFPGWPVEDRRHAATAKSHPSLSPQGAFTVEMWVKPGPELTANLQPVLLDKKYAGHNDYQMRLSAADRSGKRVLQVHLGFGNESETFSSDPLPLSAERWQHLAFTYDGAGEVRFYVDGAAAGSMLRPGRGSISPGRLPLSIGDRVGSHYAGFPGWIDEVRLCKGVLEFRPLAVEFEMTRRTWLRMEPSPTLTVRVRNLVREPVDGLTLQLSVPGGDSQTLTVPALAAGEAWETPYRIDTSLRPDTYRLLAQVDLAGEQPYSSAESTQWVLVPRPLEKMPVMMWGLGSPAAVLQELPRLQSLGFTHSLGGRADVGAIWQAEQPVAPASEAQMAETKQMLDVALEKDFGIAFALSPGHWLKDRKDLQRVDRAGKPYTSRPDVNAALPQLPQFCYNVGASVAQAYQDYPAWQAVLVNTETRDSSQLSFSPQDHQAYRQATGAEIPAEAVIKNGVPWTTLKGFPADRIVPDDHPLLTYYRWFWTVGDGWNSLHSAVHRGVKSTGREDVWTWFDPAIRAPSLPGSGGSVDVLGQWTYTNPDPPRIGYFTDELLAMAAHAAHDQQAMKMTQLFWYRTTTAPNNANTQHIANPFDDHDPDAAYITISPMHLRESFWNKIARPVRGIMYHGWQALVPTDSTSGYRHTHPDTQEEFRRLHHDVLPPLGPMLLNLDDRDSDVAYLNSFTAQMFGRRGSYGYSGDEAYLMLMHAQLQPQVVFEETVLAGDLDRFKILVLADCDVLPATVAARIQEFQARGGILVGDENLAPGISADLQIPKLRRSKQADADHAAILSAAARLRGDLDARYRRYAESTNPQILTRCRQAGSSDYVFVVNDRRELGDYVGQHGLVMENGLPSEGEILLQRAGGHVYDLVAGRQLPDTSVQRKGEQLRWPVALGPCEGGIFLVTPQPIHAVRIDTVTSAHLGETLEVAMTVLDRDGAPVPATLPVEVEISDPAGRLAEFSGHHAAVDGSLKLQLDLAANDRPGVWQIRVRERASGLETTEHVKVLKTEPTSSGD